MSCSSIIKSKGKTIEEAVNSALNTLKLTRDEVDIKIVENPESGFFGLFGKKEAVVEVQPKNNPISKAETFLKEMFSAMKIECAIASNLEDDVLNIQITGEDVGTLIGRRGQTLDSIQYLTSLVVNRQKKEYVRVLIDVENYRSKREKTLIDVAHRFADKAVRYHKSMRLEPMNASERRIIHSALQDNEDVYTFSAGEEPYRYVVVDLKNKN